VLVQRDHVGQRDAGERPARNAGVLVSTASLSPSTAAGRQHTLGTLQGDVR
jgi:hypothetical protein